MGGAILNDYQPTLSFAKKNKPKNVALLFNVNIDLLRRGKGRIKSEGERIISKEKSIAMSREKWEEKRIGGQMGNMSLQTASLDVDTLLNVSIPNRETLALLNHQTFIPTVKGFLRIWALHDSDLDRKPSRYHYIVEYENDRMIFTYDPENFEMKLNEHYFPSFEKYEKENGKVERIILGGFHLVKPSRVSEFDEIFRSRVGIENRRIFFESGEFQNRKTRETFEKRFFPSLYCAGMNLCEFASHDSESLENLNMLVMHEPEFALAWKREWKKNEKERAAKALAFGNLCASYKAEFGKTPGFRDFGKLKLVCRPKKEINGMIEKLKRRSRSFRALESKGEIVAVPALKAKRKFSVGLGDTFAAGCFLLI